MCVLLVGGADDTASRVLSEPVRRLMYGRADAVVGVGGSYGLGWGKLADGAQRGRERTERGRERGEGKAC